LHLSSSFDLVPRTLLLQKLSAYGLSVAYVILLRSYLTSRYFAVWIHHSFDTFWRASWCSSRTCPRPHIV